MTASRQASIVVKTPLRQKLDPDAGLRKALRTIVNTRLREVLSFEQAVLADSGPDAIHDMRVAARRLRALLTVFRLMFPRKKLKKQKRSLSLLIKSLGRVRDCDIIINRLHSHRKLLPPGERIAVEVLLERQMDLRAQQFLVLKNELERLQSDGYQKAMRQFLTDSFS
ncbi:MAG: CHAD domain-containing protein [Bacteroidota bacterium]